jgi:hypothetical protein
MHVKYRGYIKHPDTKIFFAMKQNPKKNKNKN